MNIGLPRGTVLLSEHSPFWGEEFEREVARLKAFLPVHVGPYEHIGSTAVPGIAAKPIIDMMVGLPAARAALELESVLREAGYVHRPNADTRDRILFVRGLESCRTHHCSFVTLGSLQWVNALGFRNVLRADPSLAARYSELKLELAAKYPRDRASYTHEKEPFFAKVFETLRKRGNN